MSSRKRAGSAPGRRASRLPGSRGRFAIFGGALLLALSAGACDCDDTVSSIPEECVGDECNTPCVGPTCSVVDCTTEGCPDHQCCGEDGLCAVCPRSCAADEECCPGQTCNETVGICFDKFEECSTDTDCGRADRVCRPYTDPNSQQTTNRCDFVACDRDGDCPAEQSCFSMRCVVEPPCDGRCGEGEVCVLANNLCRRDPLCGAASCQGGMIMVYDDPGNVYDAANCNEHSCHCEELPPLVSTDNGRYSANGVSGGQVVVSAYDGTFGDLVLHTLDPNQGVVVRTEYVDGVPGNGTVVGGPSGARGGIGDPGPDVGRFTDLAVGGDGTVHVSYYDGDNGDLKYARRDPGGSWTVMTVDGTDGSDVGRYTAIALDPSGAPAIAYFQAGGFTGLERQTGVRLARALVAAPSQPGDFVVTGPIDAVDRPPPPCNGGCNVGEACVDDGAIGACTVATSGCDADPTTPAADPCASGDACVDLGDGNGPRCRATLTDTTLPGALPLGSGLFPSIAFRGSEPVIFYFSSLDTSLRGAEGPGFAPVILAGGVDGGGFDTADAGWYTAALAADGTIAVAHVNATTHALELLGFSGSIGAAPSLRETIDQGIGTDETILVGADVSLAATPSGQWIAVYQDQSYGDLLVARRSGGLWNPPDRYSDGALGFWADVAVDSGRAYVTYARVDAGPMKMMSSIQMAPPLDAP